MKLREMSEVIRVCTRQFWTLSCNQYLRAINNSLSRYLAIKTAFPPVRCMRSVSHVSDEDVEYKIEKGLALILWNDTFDDEGLGSLGDSPSNDRDAMAGILEKCNIEVMEGGNLTVQEVQELIIEVRNRIEKEQPDIFVCMLSTHGGQLTKEGNSKVKHVLHSVQFKDDEMDTDKITKSFNDDECPSMKGKPRLFIIESCSGRENVNPFDEARDVLVEGTTNRRHQQKENAFLPEKRNLAVDVKDARQGIPDLLTRDLTDDSGYLNSGRYIEVTPSICYKDSLVIFASPPGKFSYCDEKGWLVDCLEKAFQNVESGTEVELMDLLTDASFTMVLEKRVVYSQENEIMSEWEMQDDAKFVPFMEHMLTKDVILKLKN